ncbi:hypothetical protein [uncultured Aquimarina sp.]|uniref:hypothetical protein n=1 Tax=uncultured Aquimarina sp. TaxID=575652 RepID=UPI002620E212|nr:hypothetical protein [uncultured Aquimarina sp.]
MKHLIILIISLMSICSCNNEKRENNINSNNESIANHIQLLSKKANELEFECPKFDFKTNRVRADSIVKFFEKAKKSTGNKKIEFEKLFFCSFPNSFDKMESIFGFDSETGEPAVLYDYSGGPGGKNEGSMSHSIISYFANLKSIPSDIYFDKYVNICVNGTWQADNIREGFDIYNRFENDTKLLCNVLSKRNQKEIYSVFRFIFDGPHPENEFNDEIFNTIHPLISKENIELGSALKRAYNDLITRSKHGH